MENAIAKQMASDKGRAVLTETNGDQTASGRFALGNKAGHRFKKGESGNRTGRPVGSRNLLTVLREMLQQVTPDEVRNAKMVQVFCKRKRPTNVDAVAAVILKNAIIDGESWAIRELIKGVELTDILERLEALEASGSIKK